MVDNTKVLDQNPNPIAQVNPLQPQAPIGIANKEMGPIGIVPEIRPSGQEVKHQISPEGAELGVKEIQDRPDLTKIVDMYHAGTSVPVPSSPSGKVIMPMSEEEITDKLKTGQDDDSGKWLAGLLRKIIKVMGL